MYKVKLHKLSEPGWTKVYTNDIDLKAELYSHICSLCRPGEVHVNDDGERLVLWEPVNEHSDIDDMLNTACGCEYQVVEEVEDDEI